MDRSSSFGSTTSYFLALFKLAFASAPWLYHLTSHNIVTRRPILQKVRHRSLFELCLLVNIRFQVLFHSPPGVLFTFPSRYYTLSVTWSYLAFGDGPPSFRQDSSCPDVLRILFAFWTFSLTGLLPSSVVLSNTLLLTFFLAYQSPYPVHIAIYGLGCSNFARHYFRNRFLTFFSSG